MVGSYVPERGDLVFIDCDPQAGHEQAGRRPALVLSPRSYNEKLSLALLCPITSKVKRYPFEVELPPGLNLFGVVLSDQVRCFDWKERNIAFKDKAPPLLLEHVIAKLSTLIS